MDFISSETKILYNPRLPHPEREAAFLHLPSIDLKGHFWLSTSGSSGHIKWVALSKKAVLTSAKAVNAFLESDESDRWLCSLPSFHVAGLGIQARAYLSGAKIFFQEGWDPLLYTHQLLAHKITLSSLVPAQVFDLVQLKLKPSPTLRGVIVGGARLQPNLYEEARQLGWPLLPSYGMTEASSTIAIAANPNDPTLIVLPHLQAQTTSNGHLQFEGESLFTAYAHLYGALPRFELRPTPFITEDKGELDGLRLKLFGRDTHFIKIGGECVDLLRLERILEECRLNLRFSADAALFPIEDSRLGAVIHLATTSTDPEPLLAAYHKEVYPFEKIRKTHLVPSIPRSPLRKLLLAELKELLTF